jgi:hypothetical protein
MGVADQEIRVHGCSFLVTPQSAALNASTQLRDGNGPQI